MTSVPLQHQDESQWPPLSHGLPINFANGVHVDSLTMVCPDCRREIPEKEIRASISLFPKDVASVRAWSYCTTCGKKLTNNFRIRAAAHGFQLEEIHDGFIRVYHASTRLSILKRVWSALKRLRLWGRS
jgi:hypothetical protein